MNRGFASMLRASPFLWVPCGTTDTHNATSSADAPPAGAESGYQVLTDASAVVAHLRDALTHHPTVQLSARAAPADTSRLLTVDAGEIQLRQAINERTHAQVLHARHVDLVLPSRKAPSLCSLEIVGTGEVGQQPTYRARPPGWILVAQMRCSPRAILPPHLGATVEAVTADGKRVTARVLNLGEYGFRLSLPAKATVAIGDVWRDAHVQINGHKHDLLRLRLRHLQASGEDAQQVGAELLAAPESTLRALRRLVLQFQPITEDAA
jgi:hypothetical protein